MNRSQYCNGRLFRGEERWGRGGMRLILYVTMTVYAMMTIGLCLFDRLLRSP